jgi:pimeloyl-ACP methyl ester carboxylesterase
VPYAENDGVQIYYETQGKGTPLVLVIGLGGTVEAWKFQVPAFAEDFQVIALDNRGAGRSDKPDEPYSMKLFAEDLKTVLDDAGIDKAHILGLSMGGLITQEFYHRYPERVLSMILGCTGVGAGDPAYVYPDQNVIRVLNLQKNEGNHYEVARQRAEIFYHPSFMEKVPDLVDRLIQKNQQLPQPEYAYMRQLEACFLNKEELWNSPRLSKIKVPVLVIHGEDDAIWPLENAEYLAEHIPGAELEIIPQAGHMFFMEKIEEFNEKVIEFLKSVED